MKGAIVLSFVCAVLAGAHATCLGNNLYAENAGIAISAPLDTSAQLIAPASSLGISGLSLPQSSLAYSQVSAPILSAASYSPVQAIRSIPAQSVSALTIAAPGVSSCGPEPSPTPILPLRSVLLPVVDSPIYALPSAPLPRPVVISNKCSCTKTVQKPQLFQRIIQVRRNQRFLKRTYKPVTQSIAYNARPRC